MIPTVGRIVHYRMDARPRAAIITAVADADDCVHCDYGTEDEEDSFLVNLRVLDPELGKDATVLNAPFSTQPCEMHWSWPPRAA